MRKSGGQAPLHRKVMVGLVTGGIAGVLAQWFVNSKNPLQGQIENFANLINRNEHALVDRLKTFNDVVVSPVGDIFLAMIFMIRSSFRRGSNRRYC